MCYESLWHIVQICFQYSKWSLSMLKFIHFVEFKSNSSGTSLMDQWLWLHFPMQKVPIRYLVEELRSPMPRSRKTKTWNTNNSVTNSITILKMVRIKKNLLIKVKFMAKWWWELVGAVNQPLCVCFSAELCCLT